MFKRLIKENPNTSIGIPSQIHNTKSDTNMCYFCHILKRNPRAPQHRGIKCRDPRNGYSGYSVTGMPNKYCSECKRKTHHFWHSNGPEPLWLRCNDHT